MALTRGNEAYGEKDNGYTTADVTSASFTPPANSLLVAFVTAEDADGSWKAGLSCSGGGLTWTLRASARSNDAMGAAMFTAEVGGSPSSMTVTVDSSGNNAGFSGLRIFSYTGYDTSSPIGTSGAYESTDGTFDTSFTITLGAAPASSSEVFGGIGRYDATAAVSPGGSGGFTEYTDENVGSGWQEMQTQYRNSSTSTLVDWTTSSVQRNRVAAVAIEVKEAAGGTPASLIFSSNPLRHLIGR